jgi:hypothetical protein
MPTFDWTAFILTRADFCSMLFNILAYIPPPEQCGDGNSHLSHYVQDCWARLKDALSHVTTILAKKYELRVIHPYLPWYYHYHEAFFSWPAAYHIHSLAWNWFIM